MMDSKLVWSTDQHVKSKYTRGKYSPWREVKSYRRWVYCSCALYGPDHECFEGYVDTRWLKKNPDTARCTAVGCDCGNESQA